MDFSIAVSKSALRKGFGRKPPNPASAYFFWSEGIMCAVSAMIGTALRLFPRS
jgi:hypothetical protein